MVGLELPSIGLELAFGYRAVLSRELSMGLRRAAEAGTRGVTIVSSRQGSLIRSLAKLYLLAKHHPELADFVLIS